MKVVVSPEADKYVGDRGGVLYVRINRHRCCGGVMTLLDSTTTCPVDASDFLAVSADGIDVRFKGDTSEQPHELVIELRGRLRPRPAAFWDGCAFKP